MRFVAIALGAVAAIAVLAFAAGVLLPERHVAVVEARYAAAPETVYAVIHDVRSGPEWRTGLQSVQVRSAANEPMRWTETAEWGALTFERVVDEPPRRIVHRIVDEGQGFGGTWTWTIERADRGTRLRITEDGTISNPVYRFLSNYIFGLHTGIETYARDLGAKLGETVEPVRIAHPSRRRRSAPRRRSGCSTGARDAGRHALARYLVGRGAT